MGQAGRAVYAKNFSTIMGAGSIDARIVIGALIIKYIEKKEDRVTIEAIQENPYMQYFLGLDHFTHEPIFVPSLFVHIRKRLGNDAFDTMNQAIISGALKTEQQIVDNEINNDKRPSDYTPYNNSPHAVQSDKQVSNQGKLQLDATASVQKTFRALSRISTNLRHLYDPSQQGLSQRMRHPTHRTTFRTKTQERRDDTLTKTKSEEREKRTKSD